MSNSIVADVKAEVKNKQKEAKKMKNSESKKTAKTIIITIGSTLAVLAILGSMLYLGFNAGVKYEKNQSEIVAHEASKLVSTVPPLKK